MSKRILIVGGVAGGASCAARARRNCESSEIILFDRGPYVSFANCGLPYYVGDVITDEKKLLVASAELFKKRFNIEVRTENEVLSLDREGASIEVRNLKTGLVYRESYDALVLSPGASAIRPPLPGIDLPGIFVLRTIPDSRRIREWLSEKKAKRAVIVGGGFVGLEMAENLSGRGLSVTIVDLAPQVMPPLDPEMAAPVAKKLQENGIALHLGDGVAGFASHPGGIATLVKSGASFEADIVILAIGVRPETKLAKEAGLALGEFGGIRTDERMRTNDPKIWAVGDAVEVKDIVTGKWMLIPLAGPANRQGRVAADAICGRDARFRGIQATAVCGLFGMTVAMTGASEKALARAGITDFGKVYLHPGHHVGYYPGAKPIRLKLLYALSDGRILGAQGVGEEGVEKRIDVIAMALQKTATVYDLEESELCYAPQFGAAKDPVNIAGMIAANSLRGDLPLAPSGRVFPAGAFLLDVRNPEEFERDRVPGAVNIPLPELRDRIGELPRDRDIVVFCEVGQRAYYAVRALLFHGYRASFFSGGMSTWRTL